MLALTREELEATDTTDPAIEAIASSGIREILVLGRRGPVQAAWTPPELQELGELSGADIVVDPAELELDPASRDELEAATPIVRRNFDVLRGFAVRRPEGKPRRIVLRFRVSPAAILGEEHVTGVELVRNRLVPDGRGSVRAEATDERETVPCEVVFRSVGYHGVALGGLPFEERRGTLPNDGGRVVDDAGTPLAGVYCAGWIKRGPTGVIGTNKKDATETVDLLLEDVRAGRLPGRDETAGTLEDLLADRGAEPVLYAGWEAIDAAERAAGEPLGRPRVKLRTWDELLAGGRRTQPTRHSVE
jgi:ferredoxin--NADP+ reductase